MDLVNQQVVHKDFGKGSVVEQSKYRVEVHFPTGNKRFIFPDAFGTHLIMVDKNAAKAVKDMKKLREAEKEREAKIKENERAIRYEKHKRIQMRKKIMKNLKIHPSSQAVFWCEKEEQDKVFTNWKVFTGIIKSGKRKGEVRKLVRLHQNSAIIFTTRDLDKLEENRYISGIYMVKEGFIGKMCDDGIIPAHQDYRIQLTDKESRKILFWNYYEDDQNSKMTWSAGRFRYFSNICTAKILKDIVSLKQNTEEKDYAQKFFDYFCEMNQINQNILPKPNGILLHKGN